MKIHFKKILVSIFVILGFVFYGVYQRFNGENNPNFIFNLPGASTASATVESKPGYTQVQSNQYNLTTSISSVLYRDGQYDGLAVDAYYGDVKVRAIIQSGILADVEFLVYPKDRNYSNEINTYAMPILKAEAIKNQSAKVDIVSGATNISNAFIKSLSSALEQAKLSGSGIVAQAQPANAGQNVDIVNGTTNTNSSTNVASSSASANTSVDIVTSATNVGSTSSSQSQTLKNNNSYYDEHEEEDD